MRGFATATPRPRTLWTPASAPIITATQAYDNQVVEEPNVIYESGTWKMWYTGASFTGGHGCLNYATCTSDPTVAANWTKYASNPVIGSAGSGFAEGSMFVKVGSTYYAYWFDTNGGGNIKVATSSDGTTWGTPSTALASGGGSLKWTNTFVWNEGGNTWKMLVTGAGMTPPYTTAYATSSDGLTWTVQNSNAPITMNGLGWDTYGGAWLYNNGTKINGYYHGWFHTGPNAIPKSSGISRAHSTDAQTWTMTSQAEMVSAAPMQQAADPSVVEVNGTSYMFYSSVNNDTPTGQICVATWPGTIADLVLWP